MIFNRLLDGLFYYTSCLMCKAPLSIRNEGISENHAKNNWGFNLIFYLYGSKLIINPSTEEIYINQNPDGLIVDYRHLNKFNHVDFFNVNINCKECCSFEYSITMQVDFKHSEISQTFLDKMTFEFKEDNLIIQNDHLRYKTKLINPETGKSIIDCSLINFNDKEPKFILNKLKKLIIFS